MPVYKLSYFNAKATGELSRLILSTAGQDFEDDRLTNDTWPELKQKTPYGQVPALTVDGEQICKPGAIQRYLAREFGLYGKNYGEETQCDVILETIEQEIQPLMSGYYYAWEVDKDDIKKLTVADIAFFNIQDRVSTKIGDCTAIKDYPDLLKLIENVKTETNIKKWLETRPNTAS